MLMTYVHPVTARTAFTTRAMVYLKIKIDAIPCLAIAYHLLINSVKCVHKYS